MRARSAAVLQLRADAKVGAAEARRRARRADRGLFVLEKSFLRCDPPYIHSAS
jgi:hypothetical protein